MKDHQFAIDRRNNSEGAIKHVALSSILYDNLPAVEYQDPEFIEPTNEERNLILQASSEDPSDRLEGVQGVLVAFDKISAINPDLALRAGEEGYLKSCLDALRQEQVALQTRKSDAALTYANHSRSRKARAGVVLMKTEGTKVVGDPQVLESSYNIQKPTNTTQNLNENLAKMKKAAAEMKPGLLNKYFQALFAFMCTMTSSCVMWATVVATEMLMSLSAIRSQYATQAEAKEAIKQYVMMAQSFGQFGSIFANMFGYAFDGLRGTNMFWGLSYTVGSFLAYGSTAGPLFIFGIFLQLFSAGCSNVICNPLIDRFTGRKSLYSCMINFANDLSSVILPLCKFSSNSGAAYFGTMIAMVVFNVTGTFFTTTNLDYSLEATIDSYNAGEITDDQYQDNLHKIFVTRVKEYAVPNALKIVTKLERIKGDIEGGLPIEMDAVNFWTQIEYFDVGRRPKGPIHTGVADVADWLRLKYRGKVLDETMANRTIERIDKHIAEIKNHKHLKKHFKRIDGDKAELRKMKEARRNSWIPFKVWQFLQGLMKSFKDFVAWGNKGQIFTARYWLVVVTFCVAATRITKFYGARFDDIHGAMLKDSNLDAGSIQKIWEILPLFGSLTGLLYGALCDSFGPRKTTYYLHLFYAVGWMIFSMLPVSSGLFVFGACLYVINNGSNIGPVTVILNDMVGTEGINIAVTTFYGIFACFMLGSDAFYGSQYFKGIVAKNGGAPWLFTPINWCSLISFTAFSAYYFLTEQSLQKKITIRAEAEAARIDARKNMILYFFALKKYAHIHNVSLNASILLNNEQATEELKSFFVEIKEKYGDALFSPDSFDEVKEEIFEATRLFKSNKGLQTSSQSICGFLQGKVPEPINEKPARRHTIHFEDPEIQKMVDGPNTIIHRRGSIGLIERMRTEESSEFASIPAQIDKMVVTKQMDPQKFDMEARKRLDDLTTSIPETINKVVE